MYKLSLLLPLLFISNEILTAQQSSTDYSKNTVYTELGGAGITYSLNYDRRVTENIALRTGINYAPTLVAPGVSFIGQGSYLFGKEDEFFELGVGITYVLSDDPNIVPFSDDGNIKGALINSFIGFRSQSVEEPIFFRFGAAPFYSFFSDKLFLSGGLSFGYSF